MYLIRISNIYDIDVLNEAFEQLKKLGFSVKISQTHSSSVYCSYLKKYKIQEQEMGARMNFNLEEVPTFDTQNIQRAPDDHRDDQDVQHQDVPHQVGQHDEPSVSGTLEWLRAKFSEELIWLYIRKAYLDNGCTTSQ